MPNPSRLDKRSKVVPTTPTPLGQVAKPPTTSQGAKTPTTGLGDGLLSPMAEGMAFGAGSSIGHRAIDAMLGSPNKQPTKIVVEPCKYELDKYIECVNGGIDFCEVLHTNYLECINKK